MRVGIGSPASVASPSDGQTVNSGNITYTYHLSTTTWDIDVQTNQIFVSELVNDPSNITFSSGKIFKNGIDVGSSSTVSNGDVIKLSVTNPVLNIINNYAFVVDGTNLEFNVELNDPETSNYTVEVSQSSVNDDQERNLETNPNSANAAENVLDEQIKSVLEGEIQAFSNSSIISNTSELESTESKEKLATLIQEKIIEVIKDPDFVEQLITSEVLKVALKGIDVLSEVDLDELRKVLITTFRTPEVLEVEHFSEVDKLETFNSKAKKKLQSYQELFDSNQRLIYLGQKITKLSETYFDNNRKRELMNELFKLVQIENSKRQKVSLKQKKCIKNKQVILKKEVKKKVAIIRKQKMKAKKETSLIHSNPKRILVIGDSVRLEDGKTVGTIDKIEKNKAVVNYGLFTTSVNIDRLEYASD